MSEKLSNYKTIVFLSSVVTMLGVTHADSVSAVTFTDIAAGDQAGIDYRSYETPNDVIWDLLKLSPVFYLEVGTVMPGKSRGNPGVAIFDYDLDGDKDIYVSNSSVTHSDVLYASQLNDTGELTFVDVTEEAGLHAPEFSATAMCFADTDNDGDTDLYVLSTPHNRFLVNNGDGTFKDVSERSRLNISNQFPSSCSFGDVDNDGFVDLSIANSYDSWENRLALRLFEFGFLMKPNQLMMNKGKNVFRDASAESGIQNVSRISWGVAFVDYDMDGDVDLFSADDQGPKPPAELGGQDDGYVRLYENDGTGHFTDITEAAGTNRFGAWMGISFGDYNHDGNMDFFSTNAGDYLVALMAPLVGGGEWPSIWFFGQDDGTFVKGELGDLGTSPFGWGTASADYDNDGDTDILFAGGLDMGAFVAANPGAVLNNDGTGAFNRDGAALPSSDYHLRRNIQGFAAGDLNDDGFVDIVDVSNQNWQEFMPLADYPALGGQFDGVAKFWPTFTPIDPLDPFAGFVWNGVDPEDGTLSVKVNSGDNGNNWVKVDTVGSVRLTPRGRSNRDGIGAVVKFTPDDGLTAMTPVLSGASHTSSHALELVFGLGDADKGTMEVVWPGGVRNRLYNVEASETVLFPEIPCSYDDASMSFGKYTMCVARALKDLQFHGVIDAGQAARFKASALQAYKEANG